MNNAELILYPTETVYGLGVNPFDKKSLNKLYELKGREEGKPVTWLVRDWNDIERYAEVNEVAKSLADLFLPGPLSLVLKLRPEFMAYGALDGTIGFRVSSDPTAKTLINEWFDMYDAPLTTTSANLSGLMTRDNIDGILAQFSEHKGLITRIINDGVRAGTPSTIVRVNDDGTLDILREGAISIDLLSFKSQKQD